MKALLIITAILIVGCTENHMPVKPFVIVDINRWSTYDMVGYIDSCGHSYYFDAERNSYHIGDTIK